MVLLKDLRNPENFYCHVSLCLLPSNNDATYLPRGKREGRARMRILMVGVDPLSQEGIRSSIHEGASQIVVAGNIDRTAETLNQSKYGAVVVDFSLPQPFVEFLLKELAKAQPQAIIIGLVGTGGVDATLGLDACTATAILEKPVCGSVFVRLLEHCTNPIGDESPIRHARIVGISAGIQKLKEAIEALKTWTRPVLILGETGTGKERVASCLHQGSEPRGPFVTVDCGAITSSLVENELFGHAAGAYTGASARHKGLIQEADGGTLFLDEIGDLPLDCQSRLLRVLQEREIRPLGETKSISVDLRILAATNVDLEKAVRDGRFREDLYYRINGMSITVPPLRDRREDIPLLAHSFLRWAKVDKVLSVSAMNRLRLYSWPGNVRELQNKILRAGALSESKLIKADELLDEPEIANAPAPITKLKDLYREEVLKAVNRAETIQEAARLLGIGKTTLYRKLLTYRS